jgi:hypothetical protein
MLLALWLPQIPQSHESKRAQYLRDPQLVRLAVT